MVLPVQGAPDKAQVVFWEPWEQHLSLQIADHVCAVRSGALFCRDDLTLKTGGSVKQIILRSFWSLSSSPTWSKSGFKAIVCSNAITHVFFSDCNEPDFGSKTG